MSQVIWKSPILITDVQVFDLPGDAEILHVDYQGSTPTMWYRCNPETLSKQFTIRVFGTGRNMGAEDLDHLGTLQCDRFVWHVFLVREG